MSNNLRRFALSLLCAACGGTTDGKDSSTDGGTMPDGATSASDPGSVTCNGGPCAVPANHCCAMLGHESAREGCVPQTFACFAGLARSCDEAADCAAGSVCCYAMSAALRLPYSTECAPAGQCGDVMDRPQVCKTDGECTNGKPCSAQVCSGKTIRTCGMLPANRCM